MGVEFPAMSFTFTPILAHFFSSKPFSLQMARPTFLLAFAYNPAQALLEVVNELKAIERLLTETEGSVIDLP